MRLGHGLCSRALRHLESDHQATLIIQPRQANWQWLCIAPGKRSRGLKQAVKGLERLFALLENRRRQAVAMMGFPPHQALLCSAGSKATTFTGEEYWLEGDGSSDSPMASLMA